MTTTAYRISIPSFLPCRLNALMRMHWSKRNRMVKGDKEIIWAYVRAADIPKAQGKRRVSVTFSEPGTAADPDGRLKNCLDGLKAAGAIVDDSGVWLELGEIKSERGPRGTVIILEDCHV